MSMSVRSTKLKQLILDGSINQAIEMVHGAEDTLEGEEFVFVVLGEEKSTPELVEAVLEAFLGTRENRKPGHSSWVHSLSHFNDILWKRRMVGWIKKFYEMSFKGANELKDSGCCDRLVASFMESANWDDVPADFHLTIDNLEWADWKYYGKERARIEMGRFETEETFLRWDFRTYDLASLAYYTKEIRLLIQRLQELGADTSEERDLLTKSLNWLHEQLSAVEHDREFNNLMRHIEDITRTLALM